jgi:hypothetical protein
MSRAGFPSIFRGDTNVSGSIIYRSLYFNSENRIGGNNNEPIFQIDPPLERTHKIKLLAANIPLSFYAFQNYTFTLQELAGGTSFTITLNGNYSSSQLVTTLNSLLTSASPNGYVYNTTFDSILGKFTITSTGSFRVTASASRTSANPNLGFLTPSTTYSLSQVADSVARITRQYVVIESDELSTTLATDARSIYNSGSDRPIVGVIPITRSAFNYEYYENSESADYLDANEAQLSRISFRCLDFLGNLIDYNGVPWAIKVGVFSDPTQ